MPQTSLRVTKRQSTPHPRQAFKEGGLLLDNKDFKDIFYTKFTNFQLPSKIGVWVPVQIAEILYSAPKARTIIRDCFPPEKHLQTPFPFTTFKYLYDLKGDQIN